MSKSDFDKKIDSLCESYTTDTVLNKKSPTYVYSLNEVILDSLPFKTIRLKMVEKEEGKTIVKLEYVVVPMRFTNRKGAKQNVLSSLLE